AKHMVESRATSPHVLQAIEVDFHAVQAARAAWKASEGGASIPLSILPFVALATCQTLREFPALNASVEGDALRLHSAVHLAIAVDLEHQGLVAPVIHNAGDLGLLDLARLLQAVAARAK